MADMSRLKLKLEPIGVFEDNLFDPPSAFGGFEEAFTLDSLFFEEENLDVDDRPGLKPCRPTFVFRMVVGMEAFFQIGSVTDVELLMFMREQDIDVEELHSVE
ncbi:MAG: hypothetical protein KatS3mg034_0442 [Vicingaceae bacterium]|nr:MAG: hypothetical protein KatS3mg034_0442 [Vicingaceae bacterium]